MAQIVTITNPLTGQPAQVDQLEHTAQQIDDAIARSLPGGAIDIDLANKADLNNSGQISYSQSPHLTSDVTLYVDSTNGNDYNAGTQSAPFKTIQAAIDSLPKDLGKYSATINVAAGTYPEDVVISGFSGGYYNGLRIIGEKDVVGSTTRNVSTINVTGCSSPIYLNGFYVTGIKYSKAIAIDSSAVLLEYMNFKCPSSDYSFGVSVGRNYFSSAYLNRCTFDGYKKGLSISNSSIVSALGCNFNNNAIGISAGDPDNGTAGIFMAGTIANTFSGNTSNTAKYGGSQIFGV